MDQIFHQTHVSNMHYIILSRHIKYSVHDLICDVNVCELWNCNIGKTSVHDVSAPSCRSVPPRELRNPLLTHSLDGSSYVNLLDPIFFSGFQLRFYHKHLTLELVNNRESPSARLVMTATLRRHWASRPIGATDSSAGSVEVVHSARLLCWYLGGWVSCGSGLLKVDCGGDSVVTRKWK